MRAGELDGKTKRHLRALAHELKPVVHVGNQGVTPGVIAAVEQALVTHELIKVKVAPSEDVELDELGVKVASSTHAELVQVIGHILVLFRRRKNKPVILLPGEKPKGRVAGNLPRTATRAKKKKRKKKAQLRKPVVDPAEEE